MGYQLSPGDYQMLVQQFDGDTEAANAALRQRGYDVPGEASGELPPLSAHVAEQQLAADNTSEQEDETAGEPDFSARPGLNTLAGLVRAQRKSIGALYDAITENIEKRYRAPDINDMLVQIGMGMMSAPGENDTGGFAGSLQRGLRGIGTYAQNRRAYETDMNKMLSQIEIQKAKDMAGLEEKYLSGAAAALKPNTGGMSYDAQRGIWVNRNNPRPTENTYDIGGGRTLVQWQDGLWREALPNGTYRVFERAGNAFNEVGTEGAR